MKQRTLAKSVTTTGIALHSGEPVTLTLMPAPENHGIVFVRTDLAPAVKIKASANNIGETQLCSCLVENNVRVSTIEHIMSALAAFAIDNIRIELNASEVPIMDGSAAPFTALIQQAGIQEQNVPKKLIKIRSPIRVEQGDKFAQLEPHAGQGFTLDFTIEFNHPLFKPELCHASIELTADSFTQSIARARTFGFLAEVEHMRSKNLAKGGSLENAVVVDERGVMNPEGLRYQDEFVRHKILDAIGDLYLLGHNIIGAYTGYKSGHALNNQLCLALLAHPEAWEYATQE